MTGRPVYGAVKVREETGSYMSIEPGSVLRLEGVDYYVTGEAKETRFGIADQPKLWVKYAVDLGTGQRLILKLVFHESFTTHVGDFAVRCTRRPDKESDVLDFVRHDPRFMQGRTVHDRKGNNVRVIDMIRGPTLFNQIASINQSHEEYFHKTLPAVLHKLADSIDALAFLHENELQHGDVRNDHIIIEQSTGLYRWIDFDYWVNYSDYDLWSVGNLLAYAVGKGIVTCKGAIKALAEAGSPVTVGPDDALLLFKYRLANLRKVYPYIPEELNEPVMRFSASTFDYYQDLSQIAGDLRAYLAR